MKTINVKWLLLPIFILTTTNTYILSMDKPHENTLQTGVPLSLNEKKSILARLNWDDSKLNEFIGTLDVLKKSGLQDLKKECVDLWPYGGIDGLNDRVLKKSLKYCCKYCLKMSFPLLFSTIATNIAYKAHKDRLAHTLLCATFTLGCATGYKIWQILSMHNCFCSDKHLSHAYPIQEGAQEFIAEILYNRCPTTIYEDAVDCDYIDKKAEKIIPLDENYYKRANSNTTNSNQLGTLEVFKKLSQNISNICQTDRAFLFNLHKKIDALTKKSRSFIERQNEWPLAWRVINNHQKYHTTYQRPIVLETMSFLIKAYLVNQKPFESNPTLFEAVQYYINGQNDKNKYQSKNYPYSAKENKFLKWHNNYGSIAIVRPPLFFVQSKKIEFNQKQSQQNKKQVDFINAEFEKISTQSHQLSKDDQDLFKKYNAH